MEAFLADLLARRKPATAANRYRLLKVFYAWLEDEGEIAADPMAKMKPPAKSQVWIAGALTAAGLAALALAFLWQDKGYWSSVLIEVGAATVLLVPLFLIQQRFERRQEEPSERIEDVAQPVERLRAASLRA